MTREYLTHKIETARAAIAFAVTGADISGIMYQTHQNQAKGYGHD